MPPGGGIHAIKIRARLAQDLVGLPKLAVLALQSLQLRRHIRRDTGAHATVALGQGWFKDTPANSADFNPCDHAA